MVLSESENHGYGSTIKQDLEPQEPASQMIEHDQEDQSLNKDLELSPLGGQNSLMSLTLNEIQLKSGKNFGSMNMDEFLANLWTNVDDNNNQLVPTSHPPNQTNEPAANEPPKLARQGSFSIPPPLCKKTVDEVWDEIQKDHQPQQEQTQNNNIGVNVHLLKQQTFGEMTLEDFLVKAGVVQEAPPSSGQNCSNNNNRRILTSFQNLNSCLDTSFGLGQLMSLGLPSPHNVATNGFSPYHHHMFPNKGCNVGEATSNAEAKYDKGQEEMNDMNAQQNKNKRIIDGPLEVVVERRQRRMIKNRESAARSRARKQAYTVELELELDQLKQENTKLKLIVEEIERKRKKEIMQRKVGTGLTKKVDRLRAIRRTVSLAW